MAKDKEVKETVADAEFADGTDPEFADGTNVERTAGHGITEGDPTPSEAEPTAEQKARAAGFKPKGNDPIVVTEENVMDVPRDMPPGPVRGREMLGGVPMGAQSLGVLRTPVEKGPQEGKIGIVDRELTELGELVGIQHGVVSHTLNQEGIEPTGLPYMRCPNCGNVNITLHNLARTSAHCVHCGWHTGSLSGEGNPPDKVPGLHEVDGGLADAGEIPKGKLEGALGMDPVEAKEGVFVQDVTRPVTVTHVGDDGERVGQTNVSLPTPDDPAEDGEPTDGVLAGNVRTGGDITSTKNRR